MHVLCGQDVGLDSQTYIIHLDTSYIYLAIYCTNCSKTVAICVTCN